MNPDPYNRTQIDTLALSASDVEKLRQFSITALDLTAGNISRWTWYYQLENGLVADGLCGPATIASLRERADRSANRAEVYAMYGDPANADGTPSREWYDANIVSCHESGKYPQLPGVPAVGPGSYVQVNIHVEPFLRSALDAANDASNYVIERLGCHNFRTIADSSTLSYHSWGIAIDIDAARNGRRVTDAVPWSAEWMELWPDGLPREFVEAMEAAGWQWGGRWRNADPMHFEWVG